MKSISVIYVVSFILAVATSADMEDVCPKNVEPCSCEGFLNFMYLTCSDFDNMNEVQNVLRTFSLPIPHLTIKHDSIELSSDVFQDICINRLVLELSQLNNIPDSLFLNQVECLNYLAITNGTLQRVPFNALLPLEHLATLSISNNRISELTEPFRMPNLITLVLNGNNMTRIHSRIFPPTLKSLSLSYNHLESLNSSLLSLSQLYWLMISDNRIKTLKDELTDLTNLEILIARGNQIECLDDSLHNLSKLQTLDLSQNRIRTLGNGFKGLDSLFNLNLSNNFLTELLDIEFTYLVNLGKLDLSENQLSFLGNSLRPLKKLSFLKLVGNRLVQIGTSFNCLNRIRVLNLSRNQLEKLDFLDNGQTDEDAECHFRDRNRLKMISLLENPLECTPDLMPFLLRLKEKNVIINGNPCQ